MFDFEIAFYLYKMSRIQSVFINSKYKSRAYYSAAMALDAHDTYVQKMYEAHNLQDIPHVGSGIEKSIIEIIETGDWKELKAYEEQFQIRDYSLLLGHGLSDTLVKKLWDNSTRSAKDLLNKQCKEYYNKILKKSELNKIDYFAQEYVRIGGKYLQAYGECLGRELLEFVRGIKGICSAEFTGEMVSEYEKIQIIEIEFCFQGNWPYLMKKIKESKRLLNVRGKSFSGIFGQTQFGIPFHLVYKENVNNSTPNAENIRVHGDLHIHTSWTDGIHTIEQMIQTAESRGYEYLAITDHSVSMRIANGLSEDQALSQIQKIRECEKNFHIKVLAGIEVDILEDGSLDYCDEVLCQFDFVIAAIHSHMAQPELLMKERLRKALSNPYVNILAHPTGRLLGRPGIYFSERAAYQINALDIIELCKEYQVALEVNCFPERLDLDAESAKLAVKKGVKLSLGTDAHSLAHMRNMDYGIKMLKDAGVTADKILNTYSYTELLDFFKNQKSVVKAYNKPIISRSKKDFQYYFRNNQEILQGKKRVIGIDLTASEDKESGWSYMTGEYAECRRIKTDAELINSIVELEPDVVSIDSPLAYPKHRCCARKDCECSKYGIMRQSERLLRHFGIMVYPCLIDSMVNLTTRGMKLAKMLRGMGYTVIESYPGVAQDVLKIPRKGKQKEQFMHLKQGLANFGITGDLLTNPQISHDEVDAITSALVGYFYLNGQYVGLGNEDEDYLIVPRIREELLQKRIIIGLSGETGAGKTTVTEYLRFKYGLKSFRYSQIIAEKYHVVDKTELQQIGAGIAQDEREQRALTSYMVERMEKNQGYVIDGLRHRENFEELKKNFGDDFIFIYIQCGYKKRRVRYQKLNFNQVSDEDFRIINDHVSECDIALLQMMTEYRVDNNKGYKDLWEQIDKIISLKCGDNS